MSGFVSPMGQAGSPVNFPTLSFSVRFLGRSAMKFSDRLARAVKKSGSVTCVGLDPRKAQLPAPIRDSVGH